MKNIDVVCKDVLRSVTSVYIYHTREQ